MTRVAVLLGGLGAERGVSMVSGAEAAKALRAEGYEVQEIDVTRELARALYACFDGQGPDVVFNALHGPYGEDGTVQGVLEIARLPYTHSGVLASALAMDKPMAKVVLRAAGLPVPDGRVMAVSEFDGSHPMAPPYVVKPVADGSSFGVTIIERASDAGPKPALMNDSLFGGQALVEPFVPGRELTVACLNDRPLAVTDIVAASGFYDYAAKYDAGGSRHVLPADLPPEVTDACMGMASRAAAALGCRGLSRTDFRWDERAGLKGLFILEVNTQPGLTPTSLAPEQAALTGMDFGQLVRWMVEDASCPR